MAICLLIKKCLVFNDVDSDTQMLTWLTADILTYFFQMDYINSSNPNFLGGPKAVELAKQEFKSSQVSATTLMELNI